MLPRDEDIQFNLALCQTLLKDELDAPLQGMFQRIMGFPLKYLSLNEWVTVAAFAYFLLMFLLILRIFFADSSFYIYIQILMVVFCIFTLGSLLFLGSKIYQEKFLQYAILQSEQAEIKSGPGENNSAITIIHSGTKVQIRQEKNDWYQVSLINGWNGWLLKKDVILITPANIFSMP